VQPSATGTLPIPATNWRPADFPQDAGMAGSVAEGSLTGRPKPYGVERVPQPPRQIQVPDVSAGLFPHGRLGVLPLQACSGPMNHPGAHHGRRRRWNSV